VNIACDAGTYLYSGKDIWRNGLAHTAVHNTVTVDHQDQMKMVSRFTWTNWAKGNVLRHDEKSWQGEHDGYKRSTPRSGSVDKRFADPVNHKRTLLSFDGDRWLVVDHLTGNQPHHYALHWLLCDGEYGVQELAPARFGIRLVIPDSGAAVPSDSKVFIQLGLLTGNGNFSVIRGDENSTRGWRSQYYGEKQFAISAILETDQPRACFWTFFGFEEDSIELAGNILWVRRKDEETSIDLQSLRL